MGTTRMEREGRNKDVSTSFYFYVVRGFTDVAIGLAGPKAKSAEFSGVLGLRDEGVVIGQGFVFLATRS